MNYNKRIEIHDNMNRKCGYCGEDVNIKDMQVDHIISQRNFKLFIYYKDFRVPEFLQHLGEDDINHKDNLICSCRGCNNYKSAFSLEDFRKEILLQIERLNNYSTGYSRAKRFGLIKEIKKEVVFYFETI